MAFIQTPQNPGLNALQQIQQGRIQQAQQQDLLAQEEARRQQIAAREALGQQFGPGAADPNAFAQITQARAQQGFADANQRRAGLAEEAQDFQLTNARRGAFARGFGIIDRAVQEGDPARIAQAVQQVGRALGAGPEDQQFVIDQIAAGVPVSEIQNAFLGPQGGQGQQSLPAGAREFAFLQSIANDPARSPEERRQAQVALGTRSRAGVSQVVDIGGVPTVVEVGPGGQLQTGAGELLVEDANGELVRAQGSTAQGQEPAVRQTPLSTPEREQGAARGTAEAAETGTQTAQVSFDRLQTGAQEAREATQSLAAIEQAQDQIERGIITGSFAEARLAAFRALEALTGITQEEVGNTEAFLAATGPLVATRIQAFGAGTGLSDADREFAAQIAGRDIGLTEAGIRRILALNAATEAARIEQFNEFRDRFVRRNPDLADLFPRQQIPEFAQDSLERVRARRRAEQRNEELPSLVGTPQGGGPQGTPRGTVTFELDEDGNLVPAGGN